MGKSTKVKFKWNGNQSLLKRVGLQKGGRVQKAVDAAVMKYCSAYTPYVTGILASSPYSVTEIGSGEVVYPGPYARYLYYGEVMGQNIPIFEDDSETPTAFYSPKGKKKHLTGEKLTYNTDKNPLAGPFWDRRMAADHIQDIVEEAKKVAGNK